MPGAAGETTRRWTFPTVHCNLELPTGEWGGRDGDGVCKFEGSTHDNQKFIHTGPMIDGVHTPWKNIFPNQTCAEVV